MTNSMLGALALLRCELHQLGLAGADLGEQPQHAARTRAGHVERGEAPIGRASRRAWPRPAAEASDTAPDERQGRDTMRTPATVQKQPPLARSKRQRDGMVHRLRAGQLGAGFSLTRVWRRIS